MTNYTDQDTVYLMEQDALQYTEYYTEEALMDTTTNTTTNTTTTTTTEVTIMTTLHIADLNLADMNKSALVSTMAAEMFHTGLAPTVALQTAVAFVDAVVLYADDMEEFEDEFLDNLLRNSAQIRHDNKVINVELPKADEAAIMASLIEQEYLSEDGEVGARFIELASLRQEAYAPTTGAIERRFGYSQNKQKSALFIEFIHALESNAYTVDDHFVSVALQVNAILEQRNPNYIDDEAYVLAGSQKMDSSQAYYSEFKGDTRGRGYQAACHGPNGQSSDRSRALMDLHGVEYTIEQVPMIKTYIMAEIEDMVAGGSKNIATAARARRELGDAEFIAQCLSGNFGFVKKPWSFTKAARIMSALNAGEMPYIGMAIGLDAKCSGPQLGALMVGDVDMAMACGFKFFDDKNDAYKFGSNEVELAGLGSLSRDAIKTPFMGIFYGQGAQAFQNIIGLAKEGCWELLSMLTEQPLLIDGLQGVAEKQASVVAKMKVITEYVEQHNLEVTEKRAKIFHTAVSNAFGTQMTLVRKAVKGLVPTKRILHTMPDGFRVEMNYKVKVNAIGEALGFDTTKYDVEVGAYKFINFALKTKETHTGDFARTGFVNMIQATDALIARLIVVNLKRLGAKHIISVHDCFRVNVTEMHLLEQAIKMAYMALFGNNVNEATKDLPMGTDILGMYFDAAAKVQHADAPINKDAFNQFRQVGKMSRRMPKFKFNTETGVVKYSLGQMIELLGNVDTAGNGGAFYFAK